MAANRSLSRIFSGNNAFRKIFPGLCVGASGWSDNSNLIEFVDHKGWFRNTTVEGAITGLPLDLGVVSEPRPSLVTVEFGIRFGGTLTGSSIT